LPSAALCCEIALLLAVDVSGSVDPSEYRLQVVGTAAALADPSVAEALYLAQAAVAVAQWSDAAQQGIVIPWTRILTPDAPFRLAEAASRAQRLFDESNTAVGEALLWSARTFSQVSDCRRRVIDISGDGPQNAGTPLPQARAEVLAAGIEINAIAIEDPGRAIPITEFYRMHVIGGPGFVVTAHGHLDYADAIRAKLLREVEKPGY
jgi:Ca-activated chloride channel family protein